MYHLGNDEQKAHSRWGIPNRLLSKAVGKVMGMSMNAMGEWRTADGGLRSGGFFPESDANHFEEFNFWINSNGLGEVFLDELRYAAVVSNGHRKAGSPEVFPLCLDLASRCRAGLTAVAKVRVEKEEAAARASETGVHRSAGAKSRRANHKEDPGEKTRLPSAALDGGLQAQAGVA